jgi:lysophospholipid acyltransferase (LPLAT)-like uncharacterized protein
MSDAASQSPAPKPRKSGVIVPHQPTRLQRFAGWLIANSLRCLTATIRYQVDDQTGFFNQPSGRPAIYACWHNRLALCLKLYYRFALPRNPTKGMAAMVSASKDGALLAGALEAYGVQPVRGSSSRRGRQALLELTSWAERGYDLAITPDGPRGPRYVIQEGAVALAQLTGLPIVACAFEVRWKITLKSWDRFQIPLPFSRCRISVAPIVRVPRNATDEEREAIRKKLEDSLRKITVD